MNHNKLMEIILKYDQPSGRLLSILEDIQKEEGYLPKETVKDLAVQTDTPLSGLYSIATFYSFFNLNPVGKNIISVCTGTACHVKGALQILNKTMELLGIEPEQTTEDGKFMLTTEKNGCSCTLKTARCFGACSMAPVLSVNDKIYGNVTIKQLPEILEQYGWKPE